MKLSSYLLVQQIVMGVLITLGGQLLFGAAPKEFERENILFAKRYMGLAICIIPIASFIYYFSGMKDWGSQYATATNLCAYSLTAIFRLKRQSPWMPPPNYHILLT